MAYNNPQKINVPTKYQDANRAQKPTQKPPSYASPPPRSGGNKSGGCVSGCGGCTSGCLLFLALLLGLGFWAWQSGVLQKAFPQLQVALRKANESIAPPTLTPTDTAKPDTIESAGIGTSGGNGDTPKPDTTGAPANAPQARPAGKGKPILDVAPFALAADRNALLDRPVQLKNVRVLRVLNDRAFFVGVNAEEQILVLLSDGDGSILANKTVTLSGVLRPLPEPSELQQQYNLPDNKTPSLAAEEVFLDAIVAVNKS